MAGGWSRDGAVSEQIEAVYCRRVGADESAQRAAGDSLADCAECDEPIPRPAAWRFRG